MSTFPKNWWGREVFFLPFYFAKNMMRDIFTSEKSPKFMRGVFFVFILLICQLKKDNEAPSEEMRESLRTVTKIITLFGFITCAIQSIHLIGSYAIMCPFLKKILSMFNFLYVSNFYYYFFIYKFNTGLLQSSWRGCSKPPVYYAWGTATWGITRFQGISQRKIKVFDSRDYLKGCLRYLIQRIISKND